MFDLDGHYHENLDVEAVEQLLTHVRDQDGDGGAA